MHRLVLVRHGESEWNLKNLFTGWTDVDLTEKGHEQAGKPADCSKKPAFCPTKPIPAFSKEPFTPWMTFLMKPTASTFP